MSAANPGRATGIFPLLRQALAGAELDYTSGSIRRAVILLALPMMLEMGMESVFAIVDLYFVGHLEHSSQAIQTVGLTESVLTIIYSLAIGMSMAATAVVSRRTGEGNSETASRAGAQSIILGLIITIPLSLAGMFFAPRILAVMGASPGVVAQGTSFARIMMASSVVIMLLFLINGIFRGAGNAAIAMKSLWVANLSNIVLCPLLINGLGPIPAYGLTGAAMATVIGRSIGVTYQVLHLTGAGRALRIRLAYWMPDRKILLGITRIALPAVFQFVIASCSWIILARLVADTGGDTGSAGYQTALRLMMFFMLPAWGLANAAATLVGQNLGAGKPERAIQSVTQTMKYNVLFMAMVSAIFLLIGHWLVGFFTTDDEVKAVGQQALRILSFGFILYGIGMVLVNAFNGAGDTWTPTWINLGVFWAGQVPLAYVLAKPLELGPVGVFMAIPISETLLTIISYLLFRKGNWQRKQV